MKVSCHDNGEKQCPNRRSKKGREKNMQMKRGVEKRKGKKIHQVQRKTRLEADTMTLLRREI